MALNMPFESFYDILGVNQKASTSDIKQRFQKLVLQVGCLDIPATSLF
jgi:curved DNA-binding protein CbpA